jgi:putative ABC transport system permease protein
MVKEIAAVSLMNFRNIPARLGMSSVVVVGVAGVVAVLTSVLAMHEGFANTIARSARPDRVIVLSDGAESESEGNLYRNQLQAIEDAPGIRKDAQGRAIVSAETLAFAAVAKKADGLNAFVTVRGVGPAALELRPEMRLVSGRMFRSGLRELIVGQAAQRQFAGLEIGNKVALNQGDWTVVGVFTSTGSAVESQLMGDVGALQSAYDRTFFHSITVLLESVGSLSTFRDALTVNPAMRVSLQTEPAYFAGLTQPLQRYLNLVAWVIGTMLATGALFGALNTMYFAVSSRAAEISTLRAIGFNTVAVAASVLLESMLLAVAGALIGTALAYALFHGATLSSIGGVMGASQIVYSIQITPGLIARAIAMACVLGLIGAIFPAIRACTISPSSSARTKLYATA